MSKNTIKYVSILILVVIFMYAFSSSYVSSNLDNISYVIAMGIDLAEDKKNLAVSFEFMDTSSFSTANETSSSSPIIDAVTASSITSAINLLNVYIGKKVNLSHCKVFIFSEEIAKKGIISEITEMMNNIQVRPSANIIISKDDPLEYIKNSTSTLEKVLSKYYDIFPYSSEYTGYTSNITIGKFYNNLINIHSGNVAILGGINQSSSNINSTKKNSSSSDSSSNELSEVQPAPAAISPSKTVSGNSSIAGERGTENIGLAVFNNSNYIGELTALETLCYSLLIDEVDSFLVTIPNNKLSNNYIDISFFENTSTTINIDTSNDKPKIDIKLHLKGRIRGINDTDITNSKNIDIDKITISTNNYLKKTLENYLKKTCTEFKCDINNFYNFAKKNFLTIESWESYNWSQKYKDATFNVEIDSDIYPSILSST